MLFSSFQFHPQFRGINRLSRVASPALIHVIKTACASGAWDLSVKAVTTQTGVSHTQAAEQCHHDGGTNHTDAVCCMQYNKYLLEKMGIIHYNRCNQPTSVRIRSIRSEKEKVINTIKNEIVLMSHYRDSEIWFNVEAYVISLVFKNIQ